MYVPDVTQSYIDWYEKNTKKIWREEKMQEEKANENDWNYFLGGNFLKAEHVKGEDQEFKIVKTETITEDEKKRMRLHLESDKEWLFDLNFTNTKFLKDNLEKPQDVVGKKIYFRKVMVNNPKTKQEVEGLRINKLE